MYLPVIHLRRHQYILILSILLASWLGMQALHESGHIYGALLSGGHVAQVVLNPLTLSRTDLATNPRPLIVVWAGPVLGILIPLLLWGLAAILKIPGVFAFRFFDGFCLLANGLYIGIGTFDRIGDCGQMLKYGSSPWQLWLFGLATAPFGLILWHRQGHHFGLGPHAQTVQPSVAYSVLTIFLVLLTLGFIVGGK